MKKFELFRVLFTGLFIIPVTLYGQNLMNIDFGTGLSSLKAGFAATGQTANDFWNLYSRDGEHGEFRTFGSVADLKWADGSSSHAGLTVANAPGAWGTGSPDLMFDGYLYPFDGGDIVVTLADLPTGRCDLYLYGHGAVNPENGVFEVLSGTVNYGTKSTTTASGWTSPTLQEGQHYVVFENIDITSGSPLTVIAKPGASLAVINGMQLVVVPGTILNTAPTISNIPDQATIQGNPIVAIAFTIGDAETPTPNLTLIASSSNPNLLPDSNIVISGSGATRAMTLTPVPSQTGTSTITITVSDGLASASDSFTFTVHPPGNSPPTISDIGDQTVSVTDAVVSIPFTISDVETPAANLTVSAISSNPSLVPNANIQFGGSGANRSLVIVPIADHTGSATITVIVSDGVASASDALVLTVIPSSSSTRLVRLGNASGIKGGVVTVPIELIAQGNENALGFSLSYDGAVLSFSAANLSPGVIGGALNVNQNQISAGRLGLALALPAGQAFNAGTHQIVSVSFTIASNASATSTDVAFVDQPVFREIVDSAASSLLTAYAGGTISIAQGGYEADVAPRPNGSNNGSITISDWVQTGRFAAGLDIVSDPSEFQRADCAPRSGGGSLLLGNGAVTIADWVQAGRYAAGLDPVTQVGGPVAPTATADMREARRTALAKMSPSVRTVRARDITISSGQTGSSVVELEAQGNENALGFSVTFNPLLLRFVSCVLASGGSGATLNLNTNQATSGHVGIALAMPAGQTFAQGNRALVELAFTALPGSGGMITALSFSDQPIAREIVDASVNELTASYVNGSVAIGGSAGAPLPIVSIIASDTSAAESGADPGSFIINRSGDTTAALTVHYSIGGTAINGTDYSLLGDSAVIVAGSALTTISVTPIEDAFAEIAETVTLALLSSPDYQTGLTISGTVTIADNDTGPRPPAISDIVDQAASADTVTFPIDFTVSDQDTPAENLTVTAHSSNPTLVPNAGIQFSGSGANRSLVILPAPGQTGMATITVTVSDFIATASDSFVLTVTHKNQVPIAGNDAVSTLTGTTLNLLTASILANDTDPDGDSLAVVRVSESSAHGGTVTLVGTTITYVPSANFLGSDSFTYTIKDAQGATADGIVTVAVTSPAPHPEINVGVKAVPLISWNSVSNTIYRILRKDSLNAANWTTIVPSFQATAATSSYVDLDMVGQTAFYSIEPLP